MPVVKIEPEQGVQIPYDTSEEQTKTLLEELAVAGNTAELQVALGAPLASDEKIHHHAEKLAHVVRSGERKNLNNTSTAFGAAAFLRTYGQNLALDVNQVRAALTFKLMELANHDDPKVALQAISLLGKHSDISLFTDKSEITINYKNPEELENAIKERVKRLLHADVIDMKPIGMDLDEELGVYTPPEPPAKPKEINDDYEPDPEPLPPVADWEKNDGDDDEDGDEDDG